LLVYHFAFDLTWFRPSSAPISTTDAFWLGFRGRIVTLFLALVA